MKKFIILLLAIIFCVSCKTEIDTVDNTDGMIESITHFEYNGHKYIWFRSTGIGRAAVHDPDCHCNK